MLRREFIVSLGAATLMSPGEAAAETQRLVGILTNGNSNQPPLQANVAGFIEKLGKLGWVQGKGPRRR